MNRLVCWLVGHKFKRSGLWIADWCPRCRKLVINDMPRVRQ